MRLLPCQPERRPDGKERACGDGKARLPDGSPYYIGSAPMEITRTPFRYKCHGCGNYTTLNVVAYNRLPQVTLAQLEADGLGRKMLGSDFTDDQVGDLVGAGIPLDILAAGRG